MSENFSPNSKFAQYTIVSKIGEGGMGGVYRARDPKRGRDVAIKVLPASFSAARTCPRFVRIRRLISYREVEYVLWLIELNRSD